MQEQLWVVVFFFFFPENSFNRKEGKHILPQALQYVDL